MATKNRRNAENRVKNSQPNGRPPATAKKAATPTTKPSVASIVEQLDLIQTQLSDLTDLASSPSSAKEKSSEDAVRELREEVLEQGIRLESATQQMQCNFETAIEDVKLAQQNAAEAQAEVLRSLTATMIQSASNCESVDLSEHMALFEERICRTIQRALQSNNTSTTPQPAVPEVDDTEVNVPAAEKDKTPVLTSDASQSWEQIRASFLNADDGGAFQQSHEENAEELVAAFMESEDGAAVAVSDRSPLEAETTTDLQDTQRFLMPVVDYEIEELVNIETMSEAELRAALSDRDYLVSTLIGRVRHLQDAQANGLTTEELRSLEDELPESLQNRVTETLDRMNDQLRLSELEMSLERARLSRQKVQLEQSQHSLDREARQMGLDRREDGTYVVDRSDTSRKQPRRWLGRLGIGE